MLYRVKTKLRKRYYDYACRGILRTPAIGSDKDGPVILSEVANADVLMYLVAVKSLYFQLGEERVVLLLDRDCPEENLRIFGAHVRPWKILFVEDMVSEKCPLGGTWERILTIAGLVENNYVVQVDSDTVTMGPIPEVARCVRANSSFMIGTWQGQEIEPVAVSVTRAAASSSRHVQMEGERNLTALEGAATLRYARGQSSFAGFAKGSVSVARLEAFSQCMERLVGRDKWAQWGSESFTSNFFVANADRAAVLPWPEYGSFNPERHADFRASRFLHFEGTHRFKQGAYVQSGKRAIDMLAGGRT